LWVLITGGIVLVIVVVGFLWPRTAHAQEPIGLALDPMVDYRFCGLPPRRDPDGSIHRSSTVRAAAQRAHPCPATGLPKGACPGWAIDHDWPLVAGGCDAVFNMTWMPLSIKSCARTPGGPLCKDRYEELIFATPMVIVK
jgi:hypothetical protein